MRTPSRLSVAIGALAMAVGAVPLTALAFAPVSQAEGNCPPQYFFNTITNQCQFCNTPVMYWNYETNQCLVVDPTPYVGPVLGPVGPAGVGGLGPVAGPVGPVGVGGVGPVAGPVGPVGVGGVGPVIGPVGPVGIGPR